MLPDPIFCYGTTQANRTGLSDPLLDTEYDAGRGMSDGRPRPGRSGGYGDSLASPPADPKMAWALGRGWALARCGPCRLKPAAVTGNAKAATK